VRVALVSAYALAVVVGFVGCLPEETGPGGTGGSTSVSGGSSGVQQGGTGPVGSGGITGSGGKTASGGSLSGTGGRPGSGGSGTGGALTGGSATGGTPTGGKASGGTPTGGAPTGGKASGGTPTGGAPTGGSGTAGSSEDDGANCTIGALPSGTLPTIAKLPDPFTKLDGTRMTTKAEWRCRREEIRKLAEKFAYGTKPPPPATVTGTVSRTSITVNVTDGGKSSSFTASVVLPTSGSAPYPAIIVYGGASFGAPLDSSVINSEGVALINYDPYSTGQEGTGRANKAGAFYTVYGSTSTTGLLVAWGWGVSRIIDVIAKSDGSILRADAIGVTGCSRFGKGAFVAGVFDQRVALTMPIESGTAGVPIWRNVNAEGAQTLSSAYGEQPWFGDAFSAFINNNATTAPLDTHEGIAMIAPRGLFIMDNPHIANLGPKSAHIAALAGAEVYKALGAGDAITYYSNVANGTHCSIRPEWATPLRNNIQRFLKKTGTAAGVINAYSSATGNLATWRDWTTPTLN
jgi:hypothetical protein